MGNKHSTCCVLVLGQCKSGKTRFLHLLQFGGVVTQGPTIGYYVAPYRHELNRTWYQFVEYGGRHYKKWDTIIQNTQHTATAHPFNVIYYFIKFTPSIEDIQRSFTWLLHLFVQGIVSNTLPLVLIIYEDTYVSKAHVHQCYAYIRKALPMLRVMQKRRPILLSYFCPNDPDLEQQLAYLLDWTSDQRGS